MYNSLTLVPAYGRDYASKKALLQDWQAGKDFLALCTPLAVKTVGRHNMDGYTSIRDLDILKADHVTHLHFRYKKLTEVAVVKL